MRYYTGGCGDRCLRSPWQHDLSFVSRRFEATLKEEEKEAEKHDGRGSSARRSNGRQQLPARQHVASARPAAAPAAGHEARDSKKRAQQAGKKECVRAQNKAPIKYR